jgi:outer membrane protein assembly factor BamB
MAYRTDESQLPPDRSLLIVALNEQLYALDRATGELRWRTATELFGTLSIAIDYGVIVAAGTGGGVACFDYLTGTPRWHQVTQADGRATLIIEPDHIVCAKGGYVDAFAPDGRVLWRQPLQGGGVGAIALGYPRNVAQADVIG